MTANNAAFRGTTCRVVIPGSNRVAPCHWGLVLPSWSSHGLLQFRLRSQSHSAVLPHCRSTPTTSPQVTWPIWSVSRRLRAIFCVCLSRVHQSGSGPLFHVQPRESSHTTISTKNASPSANKRLYYSCRVVLTKAIALVSVTMEFMAGHGHGAALVRATTEFMASHGTGAWRPCLTMALVRGGHGPSA